MDVAKTLKKIEELKLRVKTERGGTAQKTIREIAGLDLDIYIYENNLTIPDPYDVPHVFKNKELTVPATKDLLIYLWMLYKQDKEVLRYLHRRSQEYINHGGAYLSTFKAWLNKLEKDLCEVWRTKYGNKV